MSPTLTSGDKVIIGAIVLFGVFVISRGWGGAAKAVTGAAVDVASGAVAGVVEGVGGVVGIPTTDSGVCELAIKKGETMKASAYCSAPRFIKYLATGR